MAEKTIAAISTPVGRGGIAIVRISGDKSFEIAQKIFVRADGKSFEAQKGNTIRYGHIVSDKEVIDEVLLSKFYAPHTYTTEDTVEINCHGGVVAAREVLAKVLSAGAFPAEAGEFTKRAFLNGRIDLVEAEAVTDAIDAKTSLSLKAAQKSLSGEISKKINEIRDMLLDLRVKLEVTIEYPEYDVDELTEAELRQALTEVYERLSALKRAYKKGDILRDGIRVAICGKPNVGKSTLLNALSGTEKAIVTDIPGTTRDVVDVYLNLGGIPFVIMDTAGIRCGGDKVEAIGIERSLAAIEEADIVLFVADSECGLEAQDHQIWDRLEEKAHILVINKADKGADNAEKIAGELGEAIANAVVISAEKKEKLELLEEKLIAYAEGLTDSAEEAFMVNSRHTALITSALEAAQSAIGLFDEGMPVDLIETDIEDINSSLCAILGEEVGEEVIDEIFKRFCLGK